MTESSKKGFFFLTSIGFLLTILIKKKYFLYSELGSGLGTQTKQEVSVT